MRATRLKLSWSSTTRTVVAIAVTGAPRRSAQQVRQALPGDLGLRDEAARAAAAHALIEVGAVAARGEHHRGRLVLRSQPRRDLEAVDARHVHVEQDELGLQLASRTECLLAVGSLADD